MSRKCLYAVIAFIHLFAAFAHADDTRTMVGRIEIVGNKVYSSSKLRSLMTQSKRRLLLLPRPYDDLELENDLRRITAHYHKNGYIFASASADSVRIRDRRAEVTVAVREETRVFLRSASIEGGTGGYPITDFSSLLRLRAGLPFNPEEAAAARTRILRKFAERGFVFAEATPNLTVNGASADLTFRVNSGPLVFHRATNVAGASLVAPAAVRREVALSPGSVMLQRNITLSRSRLDDRDLFRSIIIAPVKGAQFDSAMELGRGHGPFRTIEADLNVTVEEKKPRWIAARAGYATTDRLNGGIEWGHRNVNGEGRRVSIAADASATRLSGALTLTEPWPVEWAVTGRAKASAVDEIRDAFTERRISALAGLTVPLGDVTTADVSIDVSQSEIRKVLSNARSEIFGDIADGTYNAIELLSEIERNTYDDKAFPREGSLARLAASISALELQSWKVSLQTGKVFSFGERNVLAIGGTAGYTRGFGSTTKLPSSRRFFLGGPDTLRGFRLDAVGPRDINQQPVGGEMMLLGQVEWRFFPTDRGHGVLFADAGQVFDKSSNVDLDEVVYDFGAGLRAHTQFGPIRVEYAWPVVDGEVGSGRLNFSVGYAF